MAWFIVSFGITYIHTVKMVIVRIIDDFYKPYKNSGRTNEQTKNKPQRKQRNKKKQEFSKGTICVCVCVLTVERVRVHNIYHNINILFCNKFFSRL